MNTDHPTFTGKQDPGQEKTKEQNLRRMEWGGKGLRGENLIMEAVWQLVWEGVVWSQYAALTGEISMNKLLTSDSDSRSF